MPSMDRMQNFEAIQSTEKLHDIVPQKWEIDVIKIFIS